MQFQTISDIYEINDRVRAKLRSTVESLTDEQLNALPDGEKWSVGQVVEHVSMVAGGLQRICAKLIAKAEAAGSLSDGKIDMSTLAARSGDADAQKLEAPEFVHPTGGKTVAESLGLLDEVSIGLRQLQPLYEKYDGNANKFPHPYFGDLNANEWLILAGGHEARHMRQIQRILEKIG